MQALFLSQLAGYILHIFEKRGFPLKGTHKVLSNRKAKLIPKGFCVGTVQNLISAKMKDSKDFEKLLPALLPS